MAVHIDDPLVRDIEALLTALAEFIPELRYAGYICEDAEVRTTLMWRVGVVRGVYRGAVRWELASGGDRFGGGAGVLSKRAGVAVCYVGIAGCVEFLAPNSGWYSVCLQGVAFLRV